MTWCEKTEIRSKEKPSQINERALYILQSKKQDCRVITSSQ
jgi:hypothetical protein